MARRPVPIVIISIASGAGEQVLAALDAGAVDFVQKPTALATERLLDIADELVEKVKAAARAPRADAGRRAASPTPAARWPPPAAAHGVDIVVIGISTGGPQALKLVDPAAAGRLPGAGRDRLHMPVGLHRDVRAEARTSCRALTRDRGAGRRGRRCRAWRYLAPAGRHLTFAARRRRRC